MKPRSMLLVVIIAAGGLLWGLRAGALRAETGTETMTENQENAPQKSYQCALPVSDAELRKKLSPEQYRVLRENGTEAPFLNALWNNKKPGLYVDPISGEPLFVSMDKFDSKSGWPSFTRPIDPEKIEEKQDRAHGMVRTEVRSKTSDSHLGHVFDDGPEPTGLRYCINSAALKFIPLEDLEKAGYGKYRELFEEKDRKGGAR